MRQISNFELKEEVRVDDDETKVILRYTPLGVVVGIVPWNFPLIQVLAKITPAIITGNTILVKPSPYTPYCALKLGELAQQFFPPGVVQVLSGDDRLGELLTNHHIPAKISFTGSSATGKLVMAAASQTLKSLTLELGGNDPAIVRSDIDIDTVAPKVSPNFHIYRLQSLHRSRLPKCLFSIQVRYASRSSAFLFMQIFLKHFQRS